VVESAALDTVEVWVVVERVHLVDADTVEAAGRSVERTCDRDRFAVRQGHDDVGAWKDVIEDGVGGCGGGWRHPGRVTTAGL